ncbi:hypothetical protein [Amycolatopsis rubida]|uniref:hypothetical protein n=1 Tax=Amycolatopsis rubida TaxID=112413 RepID=UPI001AD82213|nr:hypothetical protein [Amycolatopsis rubida]
MRPSDEPSGQVVPASHERSSQVSSPGPPESMLAQAIPRSSKWSRTVRPKIVADDTGWVSPAPGAEPSQAAAQTVG